MKKEALITLSLAMKAHVVKNSDSSRQATTDTCLLFCYDYVTQNTKTCAEMNSSPYTARFTKVYFQLAVKQSEDDQLQKYIKNVPHLQFGSNLTSIPQNKLLSYSISSILLSQDYTPSPTAILGIIFDFCNCFLKELQQHHDEIECSNSPTNLAALIEDFEACLDTVSSYLQSKGGVLLHLNLAFLSIMKCRICYKTSFPCSSKKIQDYIGNVEEMLQIVFEECHSFDRKTTILVYQASVLFFKASFFQDCNRRSNEKDGYLVENSLVVDTLNSVAIKCTETLDLLSTNRETEIPKRFLISLFVTKSRFLQTYEYDGSYIESSPATFGHELLHFHHDISSTTATALEAPLGVFGHLYCSCFPKKTNILKELFDACFNNVKNITYTLSGDMLDLLLKKIKHFVDMAQTREIHIGDDQFQELLLEIFTHSRELSRLMKNSDDQLMERTLPLLYRTLTDYNLQEYFEGRNGGIRNDIKFILFMAVHWLLSSYCLSLATGFNREGNLDAALDLTSKCLEFCKCFIRKMKQQHQIQRTDDDNILSLASSEEVLFIRPFMLRAAFCLEKLSMLYSQLGDYRRANSYAVGMAESVGLLRHRDVISRSSSINEIIGKMNSTFQHVRHLQSRRHLINVLSLSKSHITVGAEFLDAAGTVTSEFTVTPPLNAPVLDWSIHINLNNLDWLQERICDFILCKLRCFTANSLC
jgi:hypothetical protein